MRATQRSLHISSGTANGKRRFLATALGAVMLTVAVPVAARDGIGTAGAVNSETAQARLAEATAARLLTAARADRAKGLADIAQRVLETLIARYPDTQSASLARRDLYALYSADPRIAGSVMEQNVVSAPTGPIVSAPWRNSAVAARRLNDELSNGAAEILFFATGSTALDERGLAALKAQADWLTRYPEAEALIEGHADEEGTLDPAGEDRIAMERADQVREGLVAAGVSPHRLRVIGHGRREPVAICVEAGCAQHNRRVVVTVQAASPQARPLQGSQR